MLKKVNSIFTADAYADITNRQRALNLYWITLFLVLLHGFAFGAQVVSGKITTEESFVLLLLISMAAAVFVLNRVGEVQTAAWLFMIGTMAVAVLPTYLLDETTLTLFQSFSIWLALIVTGVIVSRQQVISFALLALALVAIVLATGINTPGAAQFSQTVSNLLFLTFTAIAGLIAWLVARNFRLLTSAEEIGETRRRLVLTQTTAAVSQRIFTRLDLETLLKDTVGIIRDQFADIYHAQVFLIDEEGKMAVLRASTGSVGAALIEKQHALAVGSTSVIGRVTEVGVPVLAADTSTDPVHKANELLPDTRTELAVPLRSQDGIIGALDVQSLKENAFSPEDVETLQTLADQIAIAVENAHLYEESQTAAQRAQSIAEASQIASRISIDFENGLESLLRSVATSGQYSHWWFGLLTSDGRNIDCVTSQEAPQLPGGLGKQISMAESNNSLVKAVKDRQRVIVNGPSGASFQMFGKHIAAPVYGPAEKSIVAALLIGRDKAGPDLGAADEELIGTVISQLSIALENRRLFGQIEAEQATLQSIINAMPTSVVVINTQKKITLVNERAQAILGKNIQVGKTFAEAYPMFRAGTDTPYPQDELPFNQAFQQKQVVSVEDLAIRHPNGISIDVLSRAAPILDASGNVSAVVTVYQDITEFRELERALQESLNETTRLYEASRAISHASTLPGITESIISQMLSLSPDQIYLILIKEDTAASELELLLSYPDDAPHNISDLGLPHTVMMPSDGLGTTNLTFATQNLHLIPGIQPEELEVLQNKGIKALAVLPLEARGQVFGTIIGVFHHERRFAPEERRFLLTLADQTAVALNGVLSFERTQATLKSISTLYEVSRAISEVQDVDGVLEVLQQYILPMKPDRIEVIISEEREGHTSLKTALDWSSDDETTQPITAIDDAEAFQILSHDEFFIESLDSLTSDEIIGKSLRASSSLYQAVASLPFRTAGQPTGRLTIAFSGKRSFSDDDRRFLRLIADSTAFVIENDMLFRQTQDSLEETGILYQAIRAFANAEDKVGILQAIIDYAADPQVDKAILCLLLTDDWHQENALMEVDVSWVRGDAVDLTGMRFTKEQFPSWEQISSPDILWVDDIMKHPDLDDTARMSYRALDIASFAIVPLTMSNRPLGAILLGSAKPRVHNEREIRIYQSLADQAALTMENLRLYDESERRARQLATSARVSQAASSILQIDELLPEMVDLIKDAFGYDQVQVFLLDGMDEYAVLQASTGEAGRQLLAIGHKLAVGSRSVIGTVTETGKPSIALDTADARVIHKPNPYLPNTRSEMAIPLVAKGKILGALDVQSNQPGAFTDSDVRVLSVLADQLAVAIENASLFQLSQRRSEEMGFLFTVTAESTTSGELDDILQRVSELLLHQINATLVVPYLYSEVDHTLYVGAVASTNNQTIGDIPLFVSMDSDDVVVEVANTKIPIVQDTMPAEQMHQNRPAYIESGIYMPLITGENFIGVLALESDQPRFFDNNTLNLLQALTGSFSAVIQNSRLLRDIQEANERLREVDKLKTNFLAAMSHELRTPLNSIIGFSRVILKGIDGPVTEMQEQDLQTIHDSGKHLLGLVNDILDQAKIEAGKMELSLEHFDIGKVIKSVMSTGEGLTKEKSIRLYTEIEPGLPEVYGDEFRTRQILFNLISNAAKFTEEGSITTSAHLTEEDGKQLIVVSVTDTGIGIREEDFAKLFESFQQVDSSTTRAAEGTGLGLPLARSLAELQGGTLRVESEYGVGSTFSVTFLTEAPAVIEEAAPAEASSNGKSVEDMMASAPKTVLVVEDSVDMINFCRRHLSNDGFDVVGATRLDDVQNKLMTTRFAAIIINVSMNDNAGWDILENITKMELPITIPTITSSLNEDEPRGQQFSAAAHLMRPFSPEDLVVAVRKVTETVSAP